MKLIPIEDFTVYDTDLKKLLEISRTLFDLNGANALLAWDQETYMPIRGVIHRARQLSTISSIFHEKLTAKETGIILDRLAEKIEGSKFNDTDRALFREMTRMYNRAVKIPEKWVREMSEAASVGLESWKVARRENKFAVFLPSLLKIVDLKREYCNLVGFNGSPYDALLDEYEPDLTSLKVTSLFKPLQQEIKNIMEKTISKQQKMTKGILRGGDYSHKQMTEITENILRRMGYDFEKGRQDISTHPFTTNFGSCDVRVTNRYIKNDLASSIFSAAHEGGHGLYEMGISDILSGTTLGSGTSLGFHESQSRLWENFIGRSRQFWKFWTPVVFALLGKDIYNSAEEDIYQEVNRVTAGYIRVDADEITYNLHIILRYEIERDLTEGKIKVKDLPEIWNEKSKKLLGIVPPNDSLGILQDIHWSQGSIGYFPTYTLGNLYAAQVFEIMNKNITHLSQHIESGNFQEILQWLRNNIHQYGSIYRPDKLIMNVSNEQINSSYFVSYLKNKYT